MSTKSVFAKLVGEDVEDLEDKFVNNARASAKTAEKSARKQAKKAEKDDLTALAFGGGGKKKKGKGSAIDMFDTAPATSPMAAVAVSEASTPAAPKSSTKEERERKAREDAAEREFQEQLARALQESLASQAPTKPLKEGSGAPPVAAPILDKTEPKSVVKSAKSKTSAKHDKPAVAAHKATSIAALDTATTSAPDTVASSAVISTDARPAPRVVRGSMSAALPSPTTDVAVPILTSSMATPLLSTSAPLLNGSLLSAPLPTLPISAPASFTSPFVPAGNPLLFPQVDSVAPSILPPGLFTPPPAADEVTRLKEEVNRLNLVLQATLVKLEEVQARERECQHQNRQLKVTIHELGTQLATLHMNEQMHKAAAKQRGDIT